MENNVTKSIIKGCLKSDPNYQKKLYIKYYPVVYGVCKRYSSSNAEAEDFMQESFLKVYNSMGRCYAKDESQLGAWIKRLSTNHCIDQFRKKKMEFNDDYDFSRMIVEEDDEVALRYTPEQVINAIQQLPPRYNAVFNLYVLDGYTHKEVSEILNLNEGTSKSNLSKARKSLQKILENIK